MWSVLDNLSALVVLPTVALIAMGLYAANSQSQVESTSRDVSVSTLHEAADWIERDLANIGSGIPAGSAAILEYEWEDAGPGSITFVSGVDSSVVAPPDTVRYARHAVGEGYYELHRYVVESGRERLDGQSPTRLQTLDLRLVRSDGSWVSTDESPAEAIAVAVRLSVPPAFANGRPSEWAQTFPFRRHAAP